ncbi:unnamed protein product [Penicillium camemberti]|uniref:Str. FM013 n=1 Tax=Penicillium camemberti (strain FM 013) TaxID=1429867 RepID=A0A0G4P301_PENC3|nr:unnamed protein product [Penicillium camemberti]
MFPHKLSASGWDIGEIKKKSVVGFSGTNDGKMTLALSVRQLPQVQQSQFACIHQPLAVNHFPNSMSLGHSRR